MDNLPRNVANPPGLLDILPTLPIEEQRAALQWLREIGTELGCTIEEDSLISKNFLDFLPGGCPPISLN